MRAKTGNVILYLLFDITLILSALHVSQLALHY